MRHQRHDVVVRYDVWRSQGDDTRGNTHLPEYPEFLGISPALLIPDENSPRRDNHRDAATIVMITNFMCDNHPSLLRTISGRMK
jgi:hypothetical protein